MTLPPLYFNCSLSYAYGYHASLYSSFQGFYLQPGQKIVKNLQVSHAAYNITKDTISIATQTVTIKTTLRTTAIDNTNTTTTTTTTISTTTTTTTATTVVVVGGGGQSHRSLYTKPANLLLEIQKYFHVSGHPVGKTTFLRQSIKEGTHTNDTNIN